MVVDKAPDRLPGTEFRLCQSGTMNICLGNGGGAIGFDRMHG